MTEKLAGKKALASGSGRRIGRAIALKLAQEGASLVVNDLDGEPSDAVAKASLVGLTRTLCKEWGRYKVNVNCAAFGLINTRLTQPIEATQATIDIAGRDIKVCMQPSLRETMDRMIPLGRGGTPEEAAGAVYMFCSPESNYVSGQSSAAVPC